MVTTVHLQSSSQSESSAKSLCGDDKDAHVTQFLSYQGFLAMQRLRAGSMELQSIGSDK